MSAHDLSAKLEKDCVIFPKTFKNIFFSKISVFNKDESSSGYYLLSIFKIRYSGMGILWIFPHLWIF